jgi:glucosylceramidase
MVIILIYIVSFHGVNHALEYKCILSLLKLMRASRISHSSGNISVMPAFLIQWSWRKVTCIYVIEKKSHVYSAQLIILFLLLLLEVQNVQEKVMQSIADLSRPPRFSKTVPIEEANCPRPLFAEEYDAVNYTVSRDFLEHDDRTFKAIDRVAGMAEAQHSGAIDTSAAVESSHLKFLGSAVAAEASAAAIPGSPVLQVAAGTAVNVWLSTADQRNKLAPQHDLMLHQGPVHGDYVINVDKDLKYQQMEGFGASFTDSSAYLLHNSLTPQARADVIKQLFSREGIHLSLIRQPMGACDYNLNLFTYDDEPGDVNLEKFSIAADKKYMIPCVREALRENPETKIFASPWSAPGWMKTSGSIIGGSLRPEYYKIYAQYFTRFVESYRDEGIPVYAVTIQNEPLYVPGHYPGMSFPPGEEASFIKTALGPEFKEQGVNTKIMIYDHNWDRPDYPMTILDDPEANKHVAGVAWHYYGGSHEAMSTVHDAYPEKEVWFTEGSGGEWVPEYHDAFMDQMKHVIRIPRNWSKSVVWWNMVLDQDHGPSLLGEGSTCRGLVKVNRRTGEVSYNVDYYTMGHISKFVDQEAYRIDSTWYENDLENVAFQNPDGSRVLIVSNRTKEEKTFTVRDGEKHFEYTVPGEGAVTFKW